MSSTSRGGQWTFTNDHSSVQGFDHAERHRAVQFHPELTPSEARALVDDHPTLLDEYSLDGDALRSRTRTLAPRWSGNAFERLIVRFLDPQV